MHNNNVQTKAKWNNNNFVIVFSVNAGWSD